MFNIMKFENPMCEPCKVMDVELNKLINDDEVDVEVEHIDTYTDDGAEIANLHEVMSTPTIIVFDEEGKVVHRISGVVDSNTLKGILLRSRNG